MRLTRLGRFGTAIFAVSMAFFGVQNLLVATGMRTPNIMSPWTVTARGWSGVIAIVAISGGLGLLTSRARAAARLLAALAFVRFLAFVPELGFNVQAEGNWTDAFQLLAWCATGLVLAGASTDASPINGQARRSSAAVVAMARLLFALSLPVFGIEHFVSARDIAPMVPSWIPWHLFWTYLAGVAFLAAAVSIATQIRARLSATLLGIMFLSWVLVLWLPAIAARPNEDNWTNAVITLAMAGGAFVIAASAHYTGVTPIVTSDSGWTPSRTGAAG